MLYMKRIAVIFDLDETIGYFGDVAVFIEAYEKYRFWRKLSILTQNLDFDEKSRFWRTKT